MEDEKRGSMEDEKINQILTDYFTAETQIWSHFGLERGFPLRFDDRRDVFWQLADEGKSLVYGMTREDAVKSLWRHNVYTTNSDNVDPGRKPSKFPVRTSFFTLVFVDLGFGSEVLVVLDNAKEVSA